MDRLWITRAVCATLAVVILAAFVQSIVDTLWMDPGSDLVRGYLPGARLFLETGSPYSPEQLAGSWSLDYHSFVHPPAALPLFLPFLVLPLPLWWIVPLGTTVYAIWRQRPAPWTWPVMALCLLWPRSTGSLVVGNSDIWAMAAVAAGTVWGWPVVLLAIKPTFAPLALVGARHRSTWIAAAVSLAFVAVTAALWWQWWTAIGNAHLSWTYSLLNLPLVVLPLVAWLGRSRARHGDEEQVGTQRAGAGVGQVVRAIRGVRLEQ